jgi:2-keto-myo-inositol isomerase
MPQYGLNGATTMPLAQAEEIRQVRAAGFDLIEFRAPKIELFLQTGTLAELKQQLDAAGLKPLSINSLEQVNTRPTKEGKALAAECETQARWAQALGCPYLVAVPGFLQEPAPEKEILPRTVDALAPLVEIAAAHGVRLGFEFLGFADCSANSLRMARQVVAKLDSASAGLVIDTFHFFLSDEPLELLGELEPGDLFLFHVNDVEDVPRPQLRDQHRVLPGDGIAPLRKMWEVLQRHELIDHASLELFRPQYWEVPPEQFLPESLASLRRVFP